jgi:hypothetical protein
MSDQSSEDFDDPIQEAHNEGTEEEEIDLDKFQYELRGADCQQNINDMMVWLDDMDGGNPFIQVYPGSEDHFFVAA